MRVNLPAVFLLPAFVLLSACATRGEVTDGCDLAQRYIEAANTSSPELIAPLIHDEAVAVFLTGEPEAYSTIEGRAAVIEAVATYTQQCDSCRSTAVCLYRNSDAVYVTERVSFVDQDGVEREQLAPLVLELEDSKIQRLVYFPAQDANDRDR